MGFTSNEYGPGTVPPVPGSSVLPHTHLDTDISNMGSTGQVLLEAGNATVALTAIGAPSATGITAIVALTQTAYNALGTKDPNTLYIING